MMLDLSVALYVVLALSGIGIAWHLDRTNRPGGVGRSGMRTRPPLPSDGRGGPERKRS